MLPVKSKYSISSVAGIFIFTLFCLVQRLTSCKDEKTNPGTLPRIKTNPVTNITDKGATFNAEIFSLGAEPLTEHGFVWGTGEAPTLDNDKVFLGPVNEPGLFNTEIKTALSSGVVYTVRSFVRSSDYLYYGIAVTFKSLGSAAPVIYNFEPDSAAWLDTMKISGKNFSYQADQNLVKLNQTSCKVVSATDTTLFVEISTDIKDLKNIVSVEIAGNISVYKTDTLKLISPKLNNFLQKKAFWGDTLHISGKHFRSFESKPGNIIKLGELKCEITGQITDTTISVRVPFELADLNSDLSMSINGISLNATGQFELLPPYFTFSPKSGTWGNTITLSGRFNTVATLNKVAFRNIQGNFLYPAYIISAALNSIKVQVPNTLSEINSFIAYEVSPFVITSRDTFKLSPPVINSFLPVSGPPGTLVTIKGKYFDIISPGVLFGALDASISSVNDSVIVAAVPAGVDGNVLISVGSRSQTVTSTDYFNVTNPKISSVFPLSGTFNDEITISGQGFISPIGPTYVAFDGINAVIKSISATSIVVSVPVTIDSIPRSLSVISGAATVTSVEKFVLSPHQVTSVSPGTILPGQDITITGAGFNPEPELNNVLIDIYPLVIQSVSTTEIIATIPRVLPRGNFTIKVIAGGYTRSSSQIFGFDSKWLRIDAPDIPTSFPDSYWLGMANYGKSISNIGYVCSEGNGGTYRFDPADNSWTRLNIPSPFDPYWHNIKMGEVVSRDTFYLIGGHYTGYSMKAFDEGHGNWRSIQPPAQMSGVAFSLSDKLYFGLDYFTSSGNFFECDPAGNYTWVRSSDFPIPITSSYSTYFSVGTEGYVVFTDKSVWQFNPDDAQSPWTRVADFPGSPRELAFSFVLADKAYIGAGKSTGYPPVEYNDIWMYDPLADSWTLVSYMPLLRHSAVAFSIGNKAYIGFGLHESAGYQNNLYDFYEFDPGYPAK
jgi:hypothetical protein